MELACTKKLLEYMGVRAQKVLAGDPLFAWTANLMVLNRRKALVVVHAASRCGFVLYGLTAKHKNELSSLILDGIRRLLKNEAVRPEVIAQYMDQLGPEVVLRANSSPKAVAACNKVCQNVDLYSDALRAEEPYQQHIQHWLNGDLVGNAPYSTSCELLLALLRERYGENIRGCRALELELELNLHTPCKRRVLVPDFLNFYQLHKVLQLCFGWQDCHLHRFVVAVDGNSIPTRVIEPQWEDLEGTPGPESLDNTRVLLSDIFVAQKHLVYEYDFGDGWCLLITLCNTVADCPDPGPRCIESIGEAPMEDCGGPEGYAHLLKVLDDPGHPEYAQLKAWADDAHRYPLAPDTLNRMLADSHRCVF